jgi:pyruvate dehydrogenase complex dehydrogenase (E1) component
VFCGDGEMDEVESLGAIGLAAREKLDNLIFVINCNLQRLDGPVRGNGKIIQELEAAFRGAGWNVLKVIWGSYWDPLLAMDSTGILRQRMEECVDGEYQNFKAKGGAYTREAFFGKYPELKEMVAAMSDNDIWRLNRGGHDPHKVYAAYAAAVKHTGQPTVILAKTIKGYGLGESGEGKNITHSQKKLNEAELVQLHLELDSASALARHDPLTDALKERLQAGEEIDGWKLTNASNRRYVEPVDAIKVISQVSPERAFMLAGGKISADAFLEVAAEVGIENPEQLVKSAPGTPQMRQTKKREK